MRNPTGLVPPSWRRHRRGSSSKPASSSDTARLRRLELAHVLPFFWRAQAHPAPRWCSHRLLAWEWGWSTAGGRSRVEPCTLVNASRWLGRLGLWGPRCVRLASQHLRL
ncbi:hypothetical protein NN561_000067 [Cricetulus griseus]